MIDKIIASLESMAETMRAMGDYEQASGVDSALWLIAEIQNRAEQTEPHEVEKIVWHKDCGWIDEQTDCPWK